MRQGVACCRFILTRAPARRFHVYTDLNSAGLTIAMYSMAGACSKWTAPDARNARFDERFLVAVHEARAVFEHADDLKICPMPVRARALFRRKICPKELHDQLVTLTISRSR